MATILLACDRSTFTADAMRRAIDLLGTEHRFVALGVVAPTYVPTAPLTSIDTFGTTIADADMEVRVEASEEDACAAELTGLLADLGIAADQRVTVGDPGGTICRVAEQIGADVVVVGAHNRGVLKRLLFGSTSSHVVRHAPCPVLVIHPEEGSTGA